MSCRFVIAALAALVLTAGAEAQPKLLMPGVTYDRQVQFTFHGPVVLHVLTGPRPGGLWSLRPALSNDALPGTETVAAIQRRLSPGATVAGVNGDRFASDGRPTGILMRSGSLEHPPGKGRSSIGLDTAGNLRVERLSLSSTWQGTGQRRPLATVNDAPGANGVSLYTPAWGATTPLAPGSVEAVLQPFPGTTPNAEVTGAVTQVASGGRTPIPADGAVLVARGSSAARLQAEAPAGARVRVRLILQPAWAGITDALGGGPVLVRNRRAVFNAGEAFTSGQLALREPRTAIGQLRDGRFVLVAVDGRSPGYSTGMNNFELALALVRLGAVTAAGLDGGGSTTMAFEGALLNRPPAGERPVSEALLVGYAGVHVPLPAEAVLSPNGDGVAETQSLAYKVVRRSSVAVSLVGPDGAARYSFSGPVEAGTYPFTWSGKTAEGLTEPEGFWRWSVTATDDLGRASSFERSFSLNNTLGFGKTVGAALPVPRRQPRAVAQFTLARAASVTWRIETRSGTVIRKAGPALTLPAGTARASWDGRTDSGAVVRTGTYVARMSAKNEVGTVSLTAIFSVRRTGSRKTGL